MPSAIRRSLRMLAITMLCAVTCSSLTAAPKKKGDKPVLAKPAVELGAPFGDNAILQREALVPVWGWSTSGAKVTVEFAGQKKSATVDKDGKWMLQLDPLNASAEAREMTVSESTGDKRVLKNILVGEVWLASGQSNMQWTVGKSAAKILADKLIEEAAANDGKTAPIREFKVTDYYSALHPIEHATGEWNDGQYSDYSAIAFSFAHKLYRELGVPIGILNCSFSQTKIEAWTPRVGYENSESDYNRMLHQQLLETDPSTSEHKKAWSKFYAEINKVVAHNQQVADDGETDFVALPTGDAPGNLSDNRGTTWMFNARLNPVIPYAIRGGIWNQGYANMDGGITYYNNLHAMIRGWRTLWENPELPVYFHQFYTPGNNDVSHDPPSIGSTAEMRLGTWLARDIPHTDMASQIDIQGAIHYGNKVVPGERLALQALKNQYGKAVIANGPMYKSYEVKGDKLIISFDYSDGGLVVAETGSNADKRKEGASGFATPTVIEKGDDQVSLFYVAGEDRVWHPAKLKIEGDKAVVSSAAVKNPCGVSYGTAGIGYAPNLYNKGLLPTTPFIVYDQKLVTSANWPGQLIKVAGVKTDPSSVGLVYEYRKFPILSTQFRDNGVLQADQPITIWGAAERQYAPHAEGEKVIHFSFNGIEKTIPLLAEMKQWKVTVPAMKASATPKTLKVSLTIDGEMVHERIVENLIIGDVWYVAGLGDQQLENEGGEISSPIRVMTRLAKGVTHRNVRPYSVTTSTTPKNRFASYWGTPTGGGFAESLAKAIHQKTGRPVGIIYMDENDLELKHWMDVPSLAEAPSLRGDYKDIAAVTPGTPYYKENAERYVDAWKAYWNDYIPEMIATKSVPDGAAWGHFPNFSSSVETKATQVYNCMLASFRRTRLKGIVFMTESSMVENTEGQYFGEQMAALANGWKRIFKSTEDPQFIYTIPSTELAKKVTKPSEIKGKSLAFEVSQWPAKDNKGNYLPGDIEALNGLVDAVIKQAY